jgi:hypothetical protein
MNADGGGSENDFAVFVNRNFVTLECGLAHSVGGVLRNDWHVLESLRFFFRCVVVREHRAVEVWLIIKTNSIYEFKICFVFGNFYDFTGHENFVIAQLCFTTFLCAKF